MLLFFRDWRVVMGKILLVVLGAIVSIAEVIINDSED